MFLGFRCTYYTNGLSIASNYTVKYPSYVDFLIMFLFYIIKIILNYLKKFLQIK